MSCGARGVPHSTSQSWQAGWQPLSGIAASYHAVPITEEVSLRMWGTLCHFDVVQTELTGQQINECTLSACTELLHAG